MGSIYPLGKVSIISNSSMTHHANILKLPLEHNFSKHILQTYMLQIVEMQIKILEERWGFALPILDGKSTLLSLIETTLQ